MNFSSVAELVEDIRIGKMIVLMDDEDRENEGDLVLAASHVTADKINFMATHARGLICLTLIGERCRQLGLQMMVPQNESRLGTNFTTSIDATHGVTTGISAADRAHTIAVATKADAKPSDIVQPGHIFPIRAERGGVLTRAGHTEAGCDLVRLAGLEPAAVIVEIMKEDGTMARRDDLVTFSKQYDLKMGTIADLIQYRTLNERTVECVDTGVINTAYGKFTLSVYRDDVYGFTHLALVHGKLNRDVATVVRVHVPELMRDFIGADLPGVVSWRLQDCLRYISSQKNGVAVIIGRMQTAEELMYSMNLAMHKKDSKSTHLSVAPANMTTMVGIGAQILRDLGVTKMRLMAKPAHYNIAGFGLDVVEYLEPELLN